MVRLLGCLISILGLAACAQPVSRADGVIDAEFRPYVTSFVKEGYSLGKPVDVSLISVHFAKLSSGIAGRCWSGSKLIEINSRYWPGFSNDSRELLMFHELGHCVLGLDHNNGFIVAPNYGTIEESIMYPEMINDWYYRLFRQYYLEQLFLGHGTF